MALIEDLRLLDEKRPLEVEHDDGVYTIQWPTGHWITCYPNGDVFIGKLSSGESPERIVCRKNHITGIATGPHPPQTKAPEEHWLDRLHRSMQHEEPDDERP